ncbi:MAG: hypothetical protein E7108_09150 [Bacteroidales bacterium]|jgi:hypothetical protein|nr:hypothetical protein [Bacteroidales bacterium]
MENASYFQKLKYVIKHPLVLLPTLIITIIWIVLGIIQSRYKETQALSWMNFFTFAQGGLFGGVAGAVGGIVGKILIASILTALLTPLFIKGSQPFAGFGKGIKGFFNSFAFSSFSAVAVFMLGMAIALLVYSFLNITQRWQESLVGIAGAVVLIKNIGQRGGLLFSGLFGLLKKVSKNAPSQTGVIRFLSGMSVGFLAGTGLNFMNFKWAVLIAICALILSLLFFILKSTRRTAVAGACIVAILVIPLYAQTQSKETRELRDAAKTLKEIEKKADDFNIDPNFDADAFTAKMDNLRIQLDDAQARGDKKAIKRICDQMGAEYTKATGQKMDFYKMYTDYYKNHPVEKSKKIEKESLDDNYSDEDNTSTRKSGRKESEQKSGRKSGRKSSSDDDDRESYSHHDDSDFTDSSLTGGWADEDSYNDSEGDMAAMDLAAGVLAGAAGAAGAAGGGAGAGLGGFDGFDGPGGGGEDFPDGSEDYDSQSEAEEREEEDEDENPEEEPTEGDGDVDEDVDENGEDSEEEIAEEEEQTEETEEEESEEETEEEESEEESEEENPEDEVPEETEEESEEETEEEESEEEPEEENPEEEIPEETEEGEEETEEEKQTEDESEEEESEEEPQEDEPEEEDDEDEPEPEEDEEEPEEEEEPDEEPEEEPDEEPDEESGDVTSSEQEPAENKEEPEEVDDYNYEAERAARQAEQDAINKKYQEAFNKDFEKFSKTSDEERIKEETEKDLRDQEARQKEEARQQRILDTAEKYGVKTKDEEGKQRDIDDIKKDNQKAIKRFVNKEVYKNELAIQKIYSDVELECSEKIASAELVDNVAEGTVNILGECTGPAGRQVKNWHNFTKATLLGAEEAYLEGRNVVTGTIGGMAEGALTVAQNEMGDAMKGMGGGPIKQTVATATGTVWFEGTKTVIHDLSRGKDLETSIEHAQESMVKKTGEVAMGLIVGGITDYGTGVVGKNYGGKMSVNSVFNMYKIANATKAASTEIYSRAHDNMTVGGENMSHHITSDFNDWKNSKVEQMYTNYYSKNKGE